MELKGGMKVKLLQDCYDTMKDIAIPAGSEGVVDDVWVAYKKDSQVRVPEEDSYIIAFDKGWETLLFRPELEATIELIG